MGNKQWDKTLHTNTSGDDEIGLAIQTNDGCFAMANYTLGGIGGDKTQPSWLDPFGAPTVDYWIIKFCDSTATTEINNLQSSTSNFQIFPNPANDFITISFTLKGEKNVSAEVYDLYGRKVFQKQFQTLNFKLQTQIDMRSFPGGIYIVEINTGEGIYRKKVLKE